MASPTFMCSGWLSARDVFLALVGGGQSQALAPLAPDPGGDDSVAIGWFGLAALHNRPLDVVDWRARPGARAGGRAGIGGRLP